MSDRQPVEVLGVRFDNLTRSEAAQAIVSLARADGKHYVVKPYSEFLPRAHRDANLRAILNGADLCLADGVGILWAAHYLWLPGSRLRALAQLPLSLAALVLRSGVIRHPLRQPMSGIDLTWDMLAEADRTGLSVYLLGGRTEEASGAASRIAERFPSLQLRGHRDGYFKRKSAQNDAVIDSINTASPDLLLVAMGFPRQEQWISANLERLNVRVAVAEGGSFSFISGATRRAPGWMRRSGLEWLFRLIRQPWRLRRQLALPLFVLLVVRERLSRAQ